MLSVPGDRPLRIGVLIDRDAAYFNTPLLDGFREKARRENVELWIFPGHIVGDAIQRERQFNVVFDIARNVHIDGLISCTSYFQHQLSREDACVFVKRFEPLPIVTLNLETAPHPVVGVDNRAGLRDLMRHLIRDHGYRRIGFMKGPDGVIDADERYSVYLDCLSEASLPLDPNIVVQGRFTHDDGRIAMEQLLDRNVRIDALAAANDGMALAAMAVAVERGLRVPQDIAITGFDDIYSMLRMGPKLTSVSQPRQPMTEVAIDLLLAHFRGERMSPTTILPTQLVKRLTCGCLDQAGPVHSADANPTGLQTMPDNQIFPYAQYLNMLEEALSKGEAAFEDQLSKIAQTCLARKVDIAHLQSMLMAMYRNLVLDVGRSAQERLKQGESLLNGHVILTNAVSVYEVNSTQLEDSSGHIFQEQNFFKRRMNSAKREDILELIASAMREFVIPSAYFVLYEQPFKLAHWSQSELPSLARVIYAQTDDVQLTQGLNSPFPTRLVLPEGMLAGKGHQVLGVFPIFQNLDHYGYMVLDMTTAPKCRLETVREELSSALIHSILLTEVEHSRDLLKSDLSAATHYSSQLLTEVLDLNRRLQALFDAAQEVAIMATDASGLINVFNLGAEAMLGYRADEVMGKSPAQFHVHSEVEQRGRELQRQLGHPVEGFEVFVANPRTGKSEIRNWTYVRKDGGQLQVSLVVSAVFGNDGNIDGFLGIARDITKEIAAQQTLESINRELDERVQRRTQALQESTSRLEETMKHLQQTQKSLVQSEKLASLGSIVAGVAHELNTPLGNCVMVTSLLKEDTLALHKELEGGTLGKKRLEQYVVSTSENIELANKALARSVKLVNSFKQVAVDQGSEQRRTFQVANAIESVVSLMRVTYRYTPYTINVHVPTDLEMNSYPGALEQLISNLVNNSVLHGFENRDQGHIEITVTDEGPSLRVVYCDDGVGMPAEVVARVFDPFFTTKLGKGGSGLGMSVCYNLVTGPLGGTIELQSAPDSGATFTLVLPRIAPIVAKGVEPK